MRRPGTERLYFGLVERILIVDDLIGRYPRRRGSIAEATDFERVVFDGGIGVIIGMEIPLRHEEMILPNSVYIGIKVYLGRRRGAGDDGFGAATVIGVAPVDKTGLINRLSADGDDVDDRCHTVVVVTLDIGEIL